MFARLSASDPLTQGDILDECPLVGLNVGSAPLDLKDPATKWWPARVIVLTQSCDLSQGKVDSVLVAPVHDAQELVAAGVLKGTVVRDQLRRHLVFGWYFLPAATAPVQMSESLIDLSRSIRFRAWCSSNWSAAENGLRVSCRLSASTLPSISLSPTCAWPCRNNMRRNHEIRGRVEIRNDWQVVRSLSSSSTGTDRSRFNHKLRFLPPNTW